MKWNHIYIEEYLQLTAYIINLNYLIYFSFNFINFSILDHFAFILYKY